MYDWKTYVLEAPVVTNTALCTSNVPRAEFMCSYYKEKEKQGEHNAMIVSEMK